MNTTLITSQQYVEQIVDTVHTVTTSIATIFDDYHPPILKTSQYIEEFNQHKEEVLALTWETLTNYTETILATT